MSQMELSDAMNRGMFNPGATSSDASLGPIPPSTCDVASTKQHLLAKFGEVKQISQLSRAVSKGAKGSTVLLSSDKTLRLDTGTRFIPVPVPELR